MKPTNEGYRFLIATALLALASLNTGNNLIYLIFSLMLSILVISWVMLRINLSRLSLGVSLKAQAYAGQETTLHVTVHNAKHRFASYSVLVRMPEGITGDALVPYIPARRAATDSIRATFARRGVYRFGDFRLESMYPFIFFRRSVAVEVLGDVTVYPEIREVRLDLRSGTGSGQAPSYRPGRGEELLMIRRFRPGDDPRRISWKASARAGALLVNEFAEENPRHVSVVLDNVSPATDEAFEKAVSYAASAVHKLITEGAEVGLVMCNHMVPPGSGPDHMLRIMDVLAMVGREEPGRCIYLDDVKGFNVLVLLSRTSELAGLAASADEVVHADAL